MPGDVDPDRLLARVVVDGTDEAIAAWIATGPGSVHRLHQELTRELRVVVPESTSDRLLLDNLTGASHEDWLRIAAFIEEAAGTRERTATGG